MRSPISFGRRKNKRDKVTPVRSDTGEPGINRPLFFMVRQVSGKSMSPKLQPGQLLLATRLFRRLKPGEVVIIQHDGMEKVKRIERIEQNKIFVIGDNLRASTDSRHFGWLESREVVARVIWPKISNAS